MSAARVVDVYGSSSVTRDEHRCHRRGVSERGGASIAGYWVPSEIWVRISVAVENVADLQAFRVTCATALRAVKQAQSARFRHLREVFGARAYTIPPELFMKSFAIHPLIPHGKGIVLIVDESDSGRGVELAWIEGNTILQTPLGIVGNINVPAATVSSIQFAPGGGLLAMLVMLRNETQPAPEHDPLKRLRGFNDLPSGRTRADYKFKPSDDCTVQIVDLVRDDNLMPSTLKVYTYSHVFVPEYGFDLAWRGSVKNPSVFDLIFIAMLHSSASAATYLVRWENFRKTSVGKYVFMACIEGASNVFVHDKRHAVNDFPNTQVTSRVELSQDGKCIFFDTVSKFGVLQFDQVEISARAFVVRADMSNDPGADDSLARGGNEQFSIRPSSKRRMSVSSPTLLAACTTSYSRPKFWGNCPRVTRMSPDGTLVCTVLHVCQNDDIHGMPVWRRSVEMLCNKTGESLFLIWLGPIDVSNLGPEFMFDKSHDVAHRILGFSRNSSIVWVRDVILTTGKCRASNHLPCFIDSRSGRIVQDFGTQHGRHRYEHIQIAPNGLTVYGTRYEHGCVFVDAIDATSGELVKEVNVTGPVRRPYGFSAWCQFHVADNVLQTTSRGDVDVLCETTRGSIGCGWMRKRKAELLHHQ